MWIAEVELPSGGADSLGVMVDSCPGSGNPQGKLFSSSV